MVNDSLVSRIGEFITKLGGGYGATDMVNRISKLNTMVGLSHTGSYGGLNQPRPPYQRHFSPLWIYKIRRDSALLNNSIDKIIKYSFKHGFSDWQKSYDAKCPACLHEFQGFDEFRHQMETDDAEVELHEDDFDFETERVCPNCEEVVQMYEPEEDVHLEAQQYFDRANMRGSEAVKPLEPQEQSSVSQTFLGVCIEIAWDLLSFDDGWMIFDRSYYIDDDGHIYDYDLEEVFRAPPELMRYSYDEETNNPGGEYWVCVKCRAEQDEYRPEEEDCACRHCGRNTYEVFAYALETPDGKEDEYFIRGEFAHDSVFMPSRFYGYPPILSLWEEVRTLEQMDKWYHDAYEERRAPRGAITVNAARDEELRTMNYQQMERLREDPNYVPLFMNDQETEGDPIQFVELLSDPAEMQHMEMREWFLERISARYGVTAILQSGSPENSGLSQSMEVVVSQQSAEDLLDVFHETYIPAFLAQIGTEGWTREVEPAVEEDESEEAQLVGQHLNNAQKFLQMGGEVEWTEDDRALLKQGELEMPEDEMGGGLDMMGMAGGMDGPRGPAPHTMEGDFGAVEEEGERAHPDDPDRPSAQPLERMLEPRDGSLEKIAAAAFDVSEVSDSERVASEV